MKNFFLLPTLLAVLCGPIFAAEKPLNVVLLYADDWRHDTLGVAGNPPPGIHGKVGDEAAGGCGRVEPIPRDSRQPTVADVRSLQPPRLRRWKNTRRRVGFWYWK